MAGLSCQFMLVHSLRRRFKMTEVAEYEVNG